MLLQPSVQDLVELTPSALQATAVLRPNTQREFVISSKFPDGAMFLSLREIEVCSPSPGQLA